MNVFGTSDSKYYIRQSLWGEWCRVSHCPTNWRAFSFNPPRSLNWSVVMQSRWVMCILGLICIRPEVVDGVCNLMLRSAHLCCNFCHIALSLKVFWKMFWNVQLFERQTQHPQQLDDLCLQLLPELSTMTYNGQKVFRRKPPNCNFNACLIAVSSRFQGLCRKFRYVILTVK